MASSTYDVRLSERDINICKAIGHYKYLSTKQIQYLFAPSSNPRSISNRMNRLRSAGFCDIRYVYTTENDITAHGQKDAIWFLQPANVRAILKHLIERGQAELIGSLRDLPQVEKEKRIVNPSHLRHEINLAWVLIYLRQAAEQIGDTVLLCEQTSTVKEIEMTFSDVTIETNKRQRSRNATFKPDGVALYQNNRAKYYIMPFIEYDNSTESFTEWRTKMTGYLRYHHAKMIPDFVRHFANLYGLNLSDDVCQGLGKDFLVLTVAKDHQRRNELLRETSRLREREQRRHFFFAALPDLSSLSITDAVWLNADAYRPIYDQEILLSQQSKNSVRSSRINERINNLTKVSFLPP